ncbi:hypothetical protein LTR27_012967 [Elasticomyces elasticus]|nr:hypothetical protein LTR27_012967 [Elasticomyces elasticus]
MDPASAIGVAAAVLQFLEFSVKVLKTCKEIRDDANSATQNNKELEKAARTLEDFRAELGSVVRSKQANRRIVTIAYECAQTAKELIDLLEYIRGGDGKLGTAKATWRAMLKRKPIERLQRSLQEREAVLDKVLNQETNTNVQALQEDVRKLGLGNRASVDQLSAKLSSLSLATNKRIGTAERNIHRRFDNVERSTQQSRDRAWQQKDYERFLSSLFFPEIDQRRSTVKAAYPDTFQWIFDVPGADDSVVPSARPTAGFGSWLRADATVYWISGKAGSGKSTLMAFILEDPRTMEALQLWSPDLPVHVLSFFFWRAGSELQNGVTGLLRSILYQLCQCIPDAVNTITRQLSITAARLPTWTESTIMHAIKATISATTNARFCLLVDGLDEFVGDYDELVDLVFGLQDLENVKCCVFLWAVLVTQSVIRGHKSGHDWQVLYDRLKRMPKGLEALFARMIDNIDPVHRRPFAFYLQSMKLFGDKKLLSSIALLTAARDPSSMHSYSIFVTACQQTELQVLGQSAGLLEIGSSWDVDFERDLSDTTEPVAFVPGSFKEAGRERVLPDPSSVLLYTEILRFEHRRINWIHRSAFEYVFPPNNTTSTPTWWAGDTAESAYRLMRGATELCLFAPSFIVPVPRGGPPTATNNGRISWTVLLSSSLIDAGQVHEATHGLDELRAALTQLHCEEVPFSYHHPGSPHDRLAAAHTFWQCCCTDSLHYVLSRSEVMIADLSDTTLLAILLHSHQGFPSRHAYYHEKYDTLDWATAQTRILKSIQGRMETAAAQPRAEMSSVVILGPTDDLNGFRVTCRERYDQLYAASYAPGLTDLQFDARVDPDFYFAIASAAISLLHRVQNKMNGEHPFDMATRHAYRDLCAQLGRVMEIIKMNVYMQSRAPHRGSEYAFTLQVPWRPLVMSLLEGKRSFENDEVPEINIVYVPVTVPVIVPVTVSDAESRWKREVFHQNILFRLRRETSRVLAGMLAWDEKRHVYEPLRLRICNHGMVPVDALQAMMLADVEANEQCLSLAQQHLLLTAIKTRLCDFYMKCDSRPGCPGSHAEWRTVLALGPSRNVPPRFI